MLFGLFGLRERSRYLQILDDHLRAAGHEDVTYGRYQETKIRHFHTLLDRHVG